MANLIQSRRGTAANWTAVNPILAQAEKGYETDSLGSSESKCKVGDGVTPWNSLPYQAIGEGDMTKSIYDIDNTGVVDDSEKVNGKTVGENVPSGALFTDTVYDDTAIQAEVTLNTAKVTNVNHPLVETAVPVGAVFTDTEYDDTAIQSEVTLNTAKVGITTQQATDITTNNAKVSYTDVAAVALNTAKVTNVNHPLVETAVPLGAVFTDTAYDDTAIQAEVTLNTAKETNIAHPLVEAAVPVGAVFTDTVYNDTDVLKDADTLSPVNAGNKLLTESDVAASDPLKINYTDNPTKTQTAGIRAFDDTTTNTLWISIDGIDIP